MSVLLYSASSVIQTSIIKILDYLNEPNDVTMSTHAQLSNIVCVRHSLPSTVNIAEPHLLLISKSKISLYPKLGKSEKVYTPEIKIKCKC